MWDEARQAARLAAGPPPERAAAPAEPEPQAVTGRGEAPDRERHRPGVLAQEKA